MAIVWLLALLLLESPRRLLGQQAAAQPDGLAQIRSYISAGWDSLTRSPAECKTLVDPKIAEPAVLYLPADLPAPPAILQLEQQCRIEVRHLPSVIHQLGQINPSEINPAGLLYLEQKYVVPGGRFNEMYGWDSYFIIRGLLRDGRIDLAQDMVDNFFFEIEHYGAVLNANRTYYLTRSQPPFLTSMIVAVHNSRKASDHDDRAWMSRAYKDAVTDYGLWTRKEHLAGSTGLSRYYDFGDGPAPESLKDEPTYYRQVAAYFLQHPEFAHQELLDEAQQSKSPGPLFSLQLCDDSSTLDAANCTSAGKLGLTTDYYKGDRAMRESGFDISFRFGPYGAATHHYAPVCLNSLLYKTERDLQTLAKLLGKTSDATKWRARAQIRKAAIQRYLWDAQHGLYFDYDFEKQTRSSYEYLTTFYPLWVGIASPEQAQSVMKHLPDFDQPGGLVMSPHKTGAQWDYPYAWAPTQLLAIEGMRRYGFSGEANRTSYKFLSMIVENFQHDGTIREKYNAVTRSSETQVTAGYQANVVGFGWTNGVFLELLCALPPELVEHLAQDQSLPGVTP